MPAKRNFIATGYYFRDSNDFDRAMAESVQIFLEDQGNGFTDADVATKLNVNLDDNVLRYFYGDKKYGASSIVDYSRIYPDAVGGDKTAGERPRNVIEVYTKGLIKQKHKWESLQKSNASKFAQYRKNQAQFEELIKEATDMRKICQDDVKKDAKELREEISRRIKKLNVPENFKPDFTQLKSYEDMYGYLSKVSESKELANMLQEQIKIISPQEMIANAHVLYGVVFRPESVARNESLKAPSRAFEWAPSANILGFWTVCKEPTESRETNIMSKEESYYSKKQLDMYQHDFTGAIEGGVGFVSPAALGAFSLAVSCNLAEGRNKELQEGGSTSKTEQKKASILLRKMQEVKICRSDIVIKVRELEKLKEAHEKNGADRESALLQWLQSNGTHFVLRLMFGVARYFEASGRFEGFDSENKASDVLSEALKGRVSAAGYRVGIGFMGKKSAAAEADSSETTSSGSTTHDTIQNTNITVLEKIYSNGLPTGLPSFELNHLVNSGNYYWTVIKRYYGKNELDCIWNILRSQHSQKMKDWEIDVDQLAKDLENIWIKNILKLQDLKLEAEDVDELISGEDVGTQLHMNLMEIKKALELEAERQKKVEEQKRADAKIIRHESTIHLQLVQGQYLGNPQKHWNWFYESSYGRMRKMKGAHMIYKAGGKTGEEIKSGDKIYLVTKNPIVSNYNCLFRKRNDYIYYSLAASVDDQKWWSIDGEIWNGGKVRLQHEGKYLAAYESWARAIEKEPDHSSTWIITKED